MSKETFEGATLEAVLEQAAEKLGVTGADLEHEVLEQKRDFWGTGDDTVTIEAWARAAEPEDPTEPVATEPAAAAAEPAAVAAEPESEAAEPGAAVEAAEDDGAQASAADADSGGFWSAEKEDITEATEEASAPSPAEQPSADIATGRKDQPEPAASVAGADGEEVEPAAIVKLLDQIFHDMEFDCTVEVEPQPDGFLATVAGDDKEALLEGNGRGLSALELIANNAFRHKLPLGNKVRVDAGDFRSRRDDELSDLALQVAHSAKESGRTQETQPLNPYERRLVHLALAEDSGVTTVSRGSGFLKNVQVIPQRGGDNRGGRGRGRRS